MPADLTECDTCGAALPKANVNKHKKWHQSDIAFEVHNAKNHSRKMRRAQALPLDF